jgi:hypothetical protein
MERRLWQEAYILEATMETQGPHVTGVVSIGGGYSTTGFTCTDAGINIATLQVVVIQLVVMSCILGVTHLVPIGLVGIITIASRRTAALQWCPVPGSGGC